MRFSLLVDTSLYILFDQCQQVTVVLSLVLHMKNELLEVIWNVNHLTKPRFLGVCSHVGPPGTREE